MTPRRHLTLADATTAASSLLALAAGLPGTCVALVLLWTRRLHAEGPVDAHASSSSACWFGSRVVAARPRRLSAADAGEPAGRAARRATSRSARAAQRARRSARRSDDRGQRAGRHAARAAAGRARSHRAAAHGDGGDRRRRLRVRPERRLRLVNRAGERLLGRPPSSCSAGPPTSSGWRRAWTASAPRVVERRVSRRRPAGGRCGARRSARAGCRTSCWC